MPTNPLPWDVHPGLTAERLTIVGRLIADTRNGAVDDYRPAKGDGPWSLGCVGYERLLNLFTKLAVEQRYSWLTMVARRGLHFTIGIGGVPFRQYRDRGRGPTKRTLVTTLPEQQALQHALFDLPPRDAELERFFRIGFSTAADGRVAKVVVFRFDRDGTIFCEWPIPLEAGAEVLGIASFRREGIELPPPPIGEKKEEKEGGAEIDGDGKISSDTKP